MRKSTKIIISCCAAFTFCFAIAAVCMVASGSKNDNPVTAQTTEQDVYVVSSAHDLAINISDPAEMGQVSTYVVLAKIDSIDGANNYSEVSQEYVLPYTYGHMTVVENIVGDLPIGESLEFYRLGGTISADQYYNGLTEVEKERMDFAKENNAALASATYIKETSDGDVDVEAGKTYLVYLVDETAYYAKPGTYAIIGFEGGLREIRTNSGEVITQSTTEATNMQVLNNFTGEWESLDNILSVQ